MDDNLKEALDPKGVHNELSEAARFKTVDEAAKAYASFMDVVYPDWKSDPNSKDTPQRVAKMHVNELSAGIFGKMPKITAFENVDKYEGIIFQSCDIKSMCSHHHLPFFGKAYIAYIPKAEGSIIGLSKINRLADFYSRRPQVQENLTIQIHNGINSIVGENVGVAVYIESQHTCVSHRGIGQDSMMRTAQLSGYFFDNEIGTRVEFYNMVRDAKSV